MKILLLFFFHVEESSGEDKRRGSLNQGSKSEGK